VASEREVLASLKILVAVAKADGKLLDEERRALETSLGAIPIGVTLQTLLDEDVDLEREIAAIRTVEAREETYRAAVALTTIDGVCSPEEQSLLERLWSAFDLSVDRRSFVDAVADRDPELPLQGDTIDDPAARARSIREHTTAHATVAAELTLAGVPGLPLAADIAVLFLQDRLVRSIAVAWGRPLDAKEISLLKMGILGLGGMRLAVGTIAKLVPSRGRALAALASFVTTWALGHVVDRFFESGGKLTQDELSAAYTRASCEGEAKFHKCEAAIIGRAAAHGPLLSHLGAELRTGAIRQAEFDARIAELV